MRRFYLLATLCVLLFTSCNKDELGGGETPAGPGNTEFLSPTHFYGKATFPETKGVAQRDNLWYPGTTIKVKLLNDPFGKAAQVEAWAKEWEEFADIRFDFVTDGDAHVRIGFDWNANRWVTWSYIGTDCKMVYDQTEATMSFAYWDSASEEEMRGDVLRAFGQVLGLELEHRHLDFDPAWTANIARYWENEINDVPWEILKKYVFDPLDAANTLQTDEYDPESIMIWPFARQYAGNTERYYNYELSDMDKAFIGTLYPKPAAQGDAILQFTCDGYRYLSFRMDVNQTVYIDWGDGTGLEAYEPSENGGWGYHDYGSEASQHTVTVYGDPRAIDMFGLEASYSSSQLYRINLTGSTGLKKLELAMQEFLDELDLSGNPELEYLHMYQMYRLNELDLSHNVNLKSLDLRYITLDELDLSANTRLESLSLEVENLSTVDLSQLSQLSYLTITTADMETVDFSALHSVKELHLRGYFTQLWMEGLTALETFYFTGGALDRIDFWDACPRLKYVSISYSSLTELDLSHNHELETLICVDTPIEYMNLRHNPVLHTVSYAYTSLRLLHVGDDNAALSVVVLTDTPLALDEPGLVELAGMLPVRTAGNDGILRLSVNTPYPQVEAICNPKGWIIQ